MIATDAPTRTAIHEAAHAVVHLARGHRLTAISVVPGDDGSLGRTTTAELLIRRRETRLEPNWMELAAITPPEEVERLMEEYDAETADDVPGEAAGIVAGEVAERIAFGSAVEHWLGRDREMMTFVLVHVADTGGDPEQAQADAYETAESILRERWAGVLALARALDERKTLTRAEAERVLAASEGDAR